MIPAIAATSVNRERNSLKLNMRLSSESDTNNLDNAHMEKGLNMNRDSTKEIEFSTKFTIRDNFLLDYTFLSLRSQLSKQKSKDMNKSKEYIYDLTNTWLLNIEIIEKIVKMSEDRSEDLIDVINRIKSKFEFKQKIRKDVTNVKGKILIDRQILEEHKRKIEENGEYYKDQLKECEENRDSKDEYIKIFEKKLKEVEIYVQKNTKTNPKFDIYKDFKMNDFINENIESIRKRDSLQDQFYKIANQRDQILSENHNFKEEMNLSYGTEEDEQIDTNCNNIYNSEICGIKKVKKGLNQQSKDKLRKFFNFYQSQVRIIEMRTKFMRNYFDNMTSKLKYFNFNLYKLKKEDNIKQINSVTLLPLNNKDVEGEEIDESKENLNNKDLNDKSGINYDMDITKKIATFMDFSVILNKKHSSDETQIDFGLNKTGLGKAENDLWDFSVI